MNYIITENAIEISKEIYRLSRPTDYDVESLNFGTLTHEDGRTALVFDLDYEILIHPLKDTARLIELTNYTPQQVIQLNAYFDDVQKAQDGEEPLSGWVLGRFPFRNIVEGYVTIYTEDEMILDGWIKIDENI